MYEAFFGFCRRPFSSAPRLEDYFPSASMEQARQMVQQCFQRAAGWAAIIGGAGVGKTLLCQRLAQDFQEHFVVLFLSGGCFSSRKELWQSFLYGLGQPYRGLEEGELRLALVEYLAQQQKKTAGFVLLVDEAHLLGGKLLEEIRIVSQTPPLPGDWFRVLLAGRPVLEERLSSPRLEAVQQRIVARCYLETWSRTETCSYIQAQLRKVAPDTHQKVFLQEAAEAVFQATNGLPRLVNQLCDHALLWAWQHGKPQVDARMVEEAWAELQQLPPPSVGIRSSETPTGLIEFGVFPEEELLEGTGLDQPPIQIPRESVCPDSEPSALQPRPAAAQNSQPSLGNHLPDPPKRPENTSTFHGTTSQGDSSPASPVAGTPAASTERAETAEISGPEHEFFLDAAQGGEPEPSSVPDVSPSPPSDSELPPEDEHLSAWDRLQQIEQALSQMDQPAELSLSPSDNGGLAEGSRMANQASCLSENEIALPTTGSATDLDQNRTPSPGQLEPDCQASEKFSPSPTGALLPSDREGSPAAFRGSVPTGLQAAASIHPPSPVADENRNLPSCQGGPGGLHPQVSSVCLRGQTSEVELVFDQSVVLSSRSEPARMEANPFAEPFLEEQWIEDPYLPMPLQTLKPGSVLEVREGTGQVVEGLPLPPRGPASVRGGRREEAPGASKTLAAPSVIQTFLSDQQATTGGLNSGSPPAGQPTALAECTSCRRVMPGYSAASQQSTGRAGTQQAANAPEPPLIVIEEDLVEEPLPEPKPMVAPVGRHEYRRLFARLRRG